MRLIEASNSEDLTSHPVLSALHAYWQAKRAGRSMPSRRQIAPEEIKPLLPHIMLAEVVDGARFRYRLVGTEVERRYGKSLTGGFIDELLDSDYGANVLALYARLMAERRPLFSRDRVEAASGAYMISERVMLPLSENDQDVNMVISAQTYRSDTSSRLTMMFVSKTASKITHEEI
jgi:hypothetical protein